MMRLSLKLLLSLSPLCLLTPGLGKDEAAPKPESTKPSKEDGGVPKEAIGFSGQIIGTVDSVSPHYSGFRIKITKLESKVNSTAVAPDKLLTRVVLVETAYEKRADGLHVRIPEQVGWITTLRPGNLATLQVTYHEKLNCFRIVGVPKPPAKGVGL